ncbi:MAG: diguanylate cyclase [Agarilytica sp.]
MENVLVVDDIQDNITLLTFELEDDDFVVHEAHNGQQCLDIANTTPQPDIILLDIHMPGMSGIETLKQLKENPRTQDIPVIMVSANTSEASVVEAIDLGANDFVSKPIEYPVLAARMRSALRLAQALRDLEKANAELNMLATTDPLTGIYNRRHFFTLVNSEIAKMSRHDRHVSIMMIDVDHFKSINDKYGHGAGDLALQELTVRFQDATRTYDILGRMGGEEFAICSPYADLAGASIMAERIRESCEQLKLQYDDIDFNVTVSIGITELAQDEGFDSGLKRADRYLYEAKKNGRNQVVKGLP